MLDSRFSLVIYFIHSISSIYVSIPISQLPVCCVGIDLLRLWPWGGYYYILSICCTDNWDKNSAWNRIFTCSCPKTFIELSCKTLRIYFNTHMNILGLPWWLSGKESTCQGRRYGVQSLGQENPLEEGMATHSSVLAWRIPWTEEPGGLQSLRSQRVRHNLVTEQQQQCVFLLWACNLLKLLYDLGFVTCWVSSEGGSWSLGRDHPRVH